jgi:hypothetical protein
MCGGTTGQANGSNPVISTRLKELRLRYTYAGPITNSWQFSLAHSGQGCQNEME